MSSTIHTASAAATGPLVLELEFARTDSADDPFAFRFVPQDYLLRSPGGGFESARFSWDSELLGQLAAVQQPGCDPTVLQAIGERLRMFVTPLGWAEQVRAIVQAAEQGRRVLLTIRSAAAELYALPWELLALKASGQHVGELINVLLRYEWPETHTTAEQPLPRAGGGRILLAWSAAGGAVPAAEHLGAIQLACRAGFHPFDPNQDVLANASPRQLHDALAAAQAEGKPIAVLHLLCHGGTAGTSFGLVLNEDAAGGSSVVDAGRLRQLLSPFARMVRLVVLMACDSGDAGALGNQLGSVAQTLHRAGIASVIASRYPLSVAGSIRFATTLYDRLLLGLESLESALLSSRETLALDATQLDWASLQLYTRAADGDDTRPVIFRIYQGLSSFGPEARRFFFGREKLAEKLWQRLRSLYDDQGAAQFLAVLGPSGSGKSSVVCAGLWSELEKQPIPSSTPLRMAILKPGNHPLQSLAAGLRTIEGSGAGGRSILFVDQFEEVYTLCPDPAERDAFVSRLLSAARDSARQSTVVLTMRSDFLGETLRHHPELNRLIADQCMVVGGMSSDELRAAIGGPARKVGRPLDDTVVELLLAETQASDGTLPLLEYALSHIFEGMLAGKEPEVTLRKIGGVGGALASRAQEIYESLSERQKATARRALVRLVKLGEGSRDTRRRAPISELGGRHDTEADVLGVLRCFAAANARLVELSGDASAPLAEVVHEALFEHWKELRGWIDQGRADRRFHERIAESTLLWEGSVRSAGRLWRPPDLDLLTQYARDHAEDLNEQQYAFWQAGLREQRNERLQRRAVAAAIIILVGVVAAIYEVEQRRTVRLAAERANERARFAESIQLSKQEIQEQLWGSFIEEGRRRLVDNGQPGESLLWLDRAYQEGARTPALLYLLKQATRYQDDVLLTIDSGAPIQWAQWSPNGSRILTVEIPHQSSLWDAASGKLVAAIKAGQPSSEHPAAWSPDGQRVLISSEEKTASVWETGTGHQLFALNGHTEKVTLVAWSPDGRFLLTGSPDKTVRLWQAGGGEPLRVFPGQGDWVSSAAFSPDSRYVAMVSSETKTARVWKLDSGKLMVTLKGSVGTLDAQSWSSDGRRLVAPSDDRDAQVWNLQSGRPIFKLTGHTKTVYSAKFSPDGNFIVTNSRDATARIWKANDGSLHAILDGHGDEVETAVFSSDSRRLLTACRDGLARVWDVVSGQLLSELTGHTSSVWSAVYSRDGQRILTGSIDGTGRVYRPAGNSVFTDPESSVESAIHVRWSPDGRRILTVRTDGSVRVWRGTDSQLHTELKGQHEGVNAAWFSQDGSRIVTASQQGIIGVFNADSGVVLSQFGEVKGAGEQQPKFSRDGRRIVTIADQKAAHVWDADSGKLLTAVSAGADKLRSAVFSPDGQRILTAHDDKIARVWNAATGKLLAQLTGHAGPVLVASFSLDGHSIVTGSKDATARVWDGDSGKLRTELRGHTGAITSANFSPDGRRVVTTSNDHTGQVWDVGSGTSLAQLRRDGDFLPASMSMSMIRVRVHGRSTGVYDASFSPDGHRILTRNDDQVPYIWDSYGGKVLAKLKGHSHEVDSVAWAADGQSILSTSRDGTARVWAAALETRTPAQIAAFIKCHLSVQFAGPKSSIIIPRQTEPGACK